MIRHTEAFKNLKDQTQETFDFAILASYAVRHLKYDLEQFGKEKGGDYLSEPMPMKPDTFDGEHVRIGKVLDSKEDRKSARARELILLFERRDGLNVLRQAIDERRE